MKDYFILKGDNVELAGAPETISVLPIGHVVSSKGSSMLTRRVFGP